MYDPIVTVERKGEDLVVTLATEIEGLDIYTSFDASTPDDFYPVYAAPLRVPRDAYVMRIITYRDGKPIGRLMSIPIEDLRGRAR